MQSFWLFLANLKEQKKHLMEEEKLIDVIVVDMQRALNYVLRLLFY